MTRTQRISLATALGLAALGAVAVSIRFAIKQAPRLIPSITLVGEVLKDDSDPAQQTPVPGVSVTAAGGLVTETRKSDPSGYFSITLKPGVKRGETVVLTFKHPDYKTLEITTTEPGDQLYVARMQPLHPETETTPKQNGAQAKIVEIKNLRVRYSSKEQSTVDVGSLAKQFSAHNTGNVPCRGRPPCSPDGSWAAARTTLPLDAGEGNEFHNVRVLCVAGPCAFTKIESTNFAHPARQITVSVLNWSDTADFLVEADVIRTMVTSAVQQSYPFIVGQTMSFALPPGSEGPCIEADLDGQYTVFPLGPDLILSWGTCSMQLSTDRNKIYRCQLKPGYRSQE
jgi:hypothetical protein